jgi:hypothetical protein
MSLQYQPLTNKAVMEKIPSRMSLQYQCTDKRKPIIKAVHPTTIARDHEDPTMQH